MRKLFEWDLSHELEQRDLLLGDDGCLVLRLHFAMISFLLYAMIVATERQFMVKSLSIAKDM